MMNKKENSLFSNIARVLSANFWVAMIGFLGNFVFPKILSIDSYALYHTFTLYVGYVAILHLGFPSGMVINYAGLDYDEIDRSQYKSEIMIVIGILAFFSAVFGIIFIATKNSMIGYVALSILPVCITNSYKCLLQSWSKFVLYSKISTIIATLVPIVALSFYFATGDLPGEIYIAIYLGVYWGVTVFVVKEGIHKVKGIKGKPILSNKNWETEKMGLALVLGSYINTLFVSVDKQFVRMFFGNTEFAFYSFGMSMQSLMTVFITSIAQPLFPAMAQGKFSDSEYNNVKRILFVFGSFSGCAYFITSFIVNHFIKNYVGSLDVVGIYFVVFPAMAVINCLYINLYKLKGLMKQYVITLASILVIAVVLNYLAIQSLGKFTGVAIATTITYYIWLVLGFKQFKFLKFEMIDFMFLVIYTVGFFVVTRNFGDIVGFIVYFIFVILISFICYKQTIVYYLKSYLKKK